MSNSQPQKTDTFTYPIYTKIFEDFLGQNDFADVEITEWVTLFKKGELIVMVPHLKMLSEVQVLTLLNDAAMSVTDFEYYYNHLKAMDVFDRLIDVSSTDTFKKV